MISTPEVTTTTEQATATIHLVIPRQEMGRHMDPAIREIIAAINGQGLRITGPMFCHHHRRPTDSFDFEIGFPVSGPVREDGRVRNNRLPAVQVVRAVYEGPYDGLGGAWGELQGWVRAQGIPETGRFIERYLNNPDKVQDPSGYRTELNWIIG
ncbi:MAG: GyrI-like domain-containing protein [Flavobacteriales bacterium]|jgi:effector-binding domain-containing protein|nr:GyrI-like domain-containing protein [Flavobacteriales bacterium]